MGETFYNIAWIKTDITNIQLEKPRTGLRLAVGWLAMIVSVEFGNAAASFPLYKFPRHKQQVTARIPGVVFPKHPAAKQQL
jgi:hypothetical protein